MTNRTTKERCVCLYVVLQFVSHPLLYKRLKMRWNLGLPKALKPHGKFRALLYLLILIETILTPLLMPIIGYAFHKDQNKVQIYFHLFCHGHQPILICIKYNFVCLVYLPETSEGECQNSRPNSHNSHRREKVTAWYIRYKDWLARDVSYRLVGRGLVDLFVCLSDWLTEGLID